MWLSKPVREEVEPTYGRECTLARVWRSYEARVGSDIVDKEIIIREN
jgi:hypothetical protein